MYLHAFITKTNTHNLVLNKFLTAIDKNYTTVCKSLEISHFEQHYNFEQLYNFEQQKFGELGVVSVSTYFNFLSRNFDGCGSQCCHEYSTGR